ncbi:BRCT domain-containing protein [Chromobacterium paludis]|uniref:BRCT domain-containing protein n=1 Tax=Chromobacterium paludis TaxID=2605945 RepID=A0A5C1DIF7_9NEIS|nr:BRCT domain-containing protein [Chromobacterium paludis]QEL55478.1 hypothetical protein FYK34_07825 [Chromobacterium paludis]
MEHDQIPAAFQAKERIKRDVSEFIGICKGVVADGLVAPEEVEFMGQWLHTHPHVLDQWPMSVLVERIPQILSDGTVDEDEQLELLRLIGQIAGKNPCEDAPSMSTDLPYSTPAPAIEFEGKLFCVTGTFEMGPRSVVIAEIEARGGLIASGVKMALDYLVVGEIGSRDWKYSTFGNKIEKAVACREKGARLAILPEKTLQASFSIAA